MVGLQRPLRIAVLFLSTLLALVWGPSAGAVEARALTECERQLLQGDPSGKIEYFNDLASVIEQNRAALTEILLAVDSPTGAKYEIEQAIKTLRNAELFELSSLKRTKTLENVAVYGSTNIPLYTLVLHAFIPASVSKNIWFRTPMVSREVYVRVFELIRSKFPKPERLNGIHVLHQPKDVQYDNFRKAHVLGLHRKGKRFERAPSEMVIFTGSPETGREVFQTNLSKMREVGGADSNYEQVFLMFGAGMNPVIITSEIRAGRMQEVVDRLIEPIRINSSQDCIAPTFCVVHENVRPQLSEALLPALRGLKLGKRSEQGGIEHNGDYFPLVFTESVEPLMAYREQYRNYLITPEAKIDPATKAVEPHVFIFPAEMWGKVPLQEHYAPFMVFFEYRTPADLQVIARDPRVQRRAMFSSVFGERGKPETEAAIRAFSDTKHEVYFNSDVFAEENGNLPFGGQGPDASSVLRVKVDSEGRIWTTEEARPLLFSREAAQHYPTSLIKVD